MENNPQENIRVHVIVKGRVQGVAFRAHVEYYALQIGVAGWVRNVGKDSVETVAEGAREKIERFVNMVKKGSQLSKVDEAIVNYEEPTGQMTGFSVKKALYK